MKTKAEGRMKNAEVGTTLFTVDSAQSPYVRTWRPRKIQNPKSKIQNAKLVALLVSAFCILHSALAQSFTNIVIHAPCPLVAVVSNGTLFITGAPPVATNRIVIDFDINPSPFSNNPLAIQTYGGYAYSPEHTPIRHYRWDFGDGTVREFTIPPFGTDNFFDAEFVDYVYAAPGDYFITYEVTDSIGDKKSLTKLIRIPLPSMAILADLNGSIVVMASNAPPGWSVKTSTNLLDWTTLTNTPGPWTMPANTGGSRFYKLSPAE